MTGLTWKSQLMASSRDVTGTVAPGRGLGAPRIADPAILVRIRDLAGFPPVPGTLNVVLPEPLERGLLSRYLAAAEINPVVGSRDGAGRLLPRRGAGRRPVPRPRLLGR